MALADQRGDDLPQPRGDNVGGAGEIDRRVVILHLLADFDAFREVGCLKPGRRVAIQQVVDIELAAEIVAGHVFGVGLVVAARHDVVVGLFARIVAHN